MEVLYFRLNQMISQDKTWENIFDWIIWLFYWQLHEASRFLPCTQSLIISNLNEDLSDSKAYALSISPSSSLRNVLLLNYSNNILPDRWTDISCTYTDIFIKNGIWPQGWFRHRCYLSTFFFLWLFGVSYKSDNYGSKSNTNVCIKCALYHTFMLTYLGAWRKKKLSERYYANSDLLRRWAKCAGELLGSERDVGRIPVEGER